ncbi:helix-turn-helix domain-containing protein [Sideroxyarcus sp. TK5]
MTSKSKFYHEEISQLAIDLGLRISTARKRRRIRQSDLALRTGLSRSTIQAIERGEVSCSMGAVLNVLWTLGLAETLQIIADPGLDRQGLTLSLSRDKLRVVIPRVNNNDF